MGKLPSSEDLWKRHERLVLNVFLNALVRLKNEKPLPDEEIPLNNLLYVLVREIWCELPKNDKPLWALIPNSETPPRNRKEIGQEWTRKKPDFRWTLSDPSERDTLRAIKDYTIECKRLDEKTSAGWDFINEYVVSGIIRFLSKEHRYGIGAESGAMIGYVQNLVPVEVLKNINLTVRKSQEYKIPEITFNKIKGLVGIGRGNHTLKRKEVSPSNFDLRHIWVELMN